VKSKIYLSAEGYGHIVSQEFIVEKLNKYLSELIDFNLQTHSYVMAATLKNVNHELKS
tara:strand:- start:195 stop:368 length:174 start_codon:yes stop_codon:yes gene_type:complete